MAFPAIGCGAAAGRTSRLKPVKAKSEKHEQIVYGVVKVSPKGQIIIPVELRNELNISAGEQLVVTKSADGEGIVLLKMKVLNDLLKGTRYYTT